VVVLAPAATTVELVEESASTVAPTISAANRARLRSPLVTSFAPRSPHSPSEGLSGVGKGV
jgi:hypothetical protein